MPISDAEGISGDAVIDQLGDLVALLGWVPGR
jgi:hypothetical protein